MLKVKIVDANPADQVMVDLHPGPWSENLQNVTVEDFKKPTGPEIVDRL